MPAGDTHIVTVHLRREKPPIRNATLASTGDEVTYGLPGWQAEHYGYDPDSLPKHPGTLDHLVSSVAGCLIGTFGGALRARDIPTDDDKLTATAEGEVVVDDDNVLRLRRITVRYTLKADPAKREAAERACAHHARHCPNARSVMPAIEIVTEVDVVPLEAPAAV